MEPKKLQSIVDKHHLTQPQLEAVIDSIQNPQSPGKIIKHNWGDRHIRIGLLSDTHIGSKHANYSVLNDIYKRFKADGVVAVYHAGDITEGYNRRKGHAHECDLHGADEQADGVRDRYPDVGLPTYFIGGDHDGWHYENAGCDIGKMITQRRDDLHYLGPFDATIQLAPKTTLALMHPATGTAYAISYKPQKIVEALSGGEKPSILGIGHFHKIEYLFYRNIHVFQSGTTENQTKWMKRMNLSAHMGGWMLDITTKKDGSIDKLTQTLYPYY
jgi:predicted phosphodiesterase